MKKVFNGIIDILCEKTGYDYDFLVERYNEVMDEDGDVDSFIAITLEKDW